MDMTQSKFTMKRLRRRKSIFIEGVHGTGKSSAPRQVCQELSIETGIPHVLIDVRLSERDEGDVIGIPRGFTEFSTKIPTYINGKIEMIETRLQNVMVHDVPVWFPRDPKMHGILLYDEITYARKSSIQAVMESFLDHSQNGVPIPEMVRVVACANSGNNLQDIYGGSVLNPAVYDRPLKIDFQPTFDEWKDYVRGINIDPRILLYLTKFKTKLDPPREMESGKAYPSRRSWVFLSEDIQDLSADSSFDPFRDHDYLTKLVKGRVGSDVAVDFMQWVKSNFTLYSAEEILNKWNDRMATAFTKMPPDEIMFYSDELTAFFKKEPKKLKPAQLKNMERFVRVIPKESSSAFFVQWLKSARESACAFYAVPAVKEYLYGNLNMQTALN